MGRLGEHEEVSLSMPYVRVSGRAIINLHSANAEGAVGNYMALSKMYIVRRTGDPDRPYDVAEDVVISGNMLKHWHAIKTVERLVEKGYEGLCDFCRRFIMFRSPDKSIGSEEEFLKRCAIEDLHGFLQPDQQIRRESIVKFAFMLPVEDLRAEYAAITHNRVVLEPTGKIQAEEAMMVFKREYASGLYGFACTLDLAYVGVPLANPMEPVISADDRRMRAKTAMLALADIITGRFGAASSRALPIMRTTELICAVAKQPLPNLIHGFFMDYAEESARVLKAAIGSGLVKDIRILVAGEKPIKALADLPEGVVEAVDSPVEAIMRAAEVVEKWLS